MLEHDRERPMETHLLEGKAVPFSDLYLDPNNPRLAPEDPPGYSDAKALFDPKLQVTLDERAGTDAQFELEALEVAILGQGWMPIDNILVWEHPDAKGKFIVLEGNRRTAALRRLRARLEKEKAKLERMTGGGKRHSKSDVESQGRRVEDLERLVDDTEKLLVVPINAANASELEERLPRVLAVRHITGAKQWGNYAEDLWLLARYEDLFGRAYPDQPLRWEQAVIDQVAHEASLGATKTRRKLWASSCFSHFRREYEDQLPDGEDFEAKDYYLFELIVSKPFPRDQLGISRDAMHLPAESEKVIFDWVFKLPRPNRAEDNENVFYRHENISLWDQMKRYDDKHGTSFAQRFNVDDHENAPTMWSVEADYTAHKARRKPADVLESLLQQLDDLSAATIRNEGSFLKLQLDRLQERTHSVLQMIAATEKG